MDENQKISILIAEYNTLRAEVLAARSYVAQAFGITAGVAMGILGFAFSANLSVPKWAVFAVGAVAVTYLVGTVVWNDINTRKFTKRIRALEADINTRSGETLLRWETDSGWGGMIVRVKQAKSSGQPSA
jgi:hypothetical protein